MPSYTHQAPGTAKANVCFQQQLQQLVLDILWWPPVLFPPSEQKGEFYQDVCKLSLTYFPCFNSFLLLKVDMSCISLCMPLIFSADGVSPSGNIIKTDRQTDRTTYFTLWQVGFSTSNENLVNSIFNLMSCYVLCW